LFAAAAEVQLVGLEDTGGAWNPARELTQRLIDGVHGDGSFSMGMP
jgi:hypothetical protein